MKKTAKVISVFLVLFLSAGIFCVAGDLEAVLEGVLFQAQTEAAQQIQERTLDNKSAIKRIKTAYPQCTKIIDLGTIAELESITYSSHSDLIAVENAGEVIYYEYKVTQHATHEGRAVSYSLYELETLEPQKAFSLEQIGQIKQAKLIHTHYVPVGFERAIAQYDVEFDFGDVRGSLLLERTELDLLQQQIIFEK